ncbi:MAG TPA: DUF2637 domain-containing protein [Pseudonocardia sp.]|jgi:hypothetical protein
MNKIDLRQVRLRIGALIVVACAAAISFMSSRDLAVMAHFGWLSWLFPVCLDAVAAVALDIWIRRTAAQRIAGWLGMTAITLSTASNAADHYLSTGMVLAAVLGVVPPAMLAWLLLVLHKHATPVPVTHPVSVPGGLVHAPGPDPAAVPVPVPQDQIIAEYQPVPVPREMVPEMRYSVPASAPITPVPVTREDRPVPPETDAEKTMTMPIIGRKVGEPGETRTKVQPAVRKASASATAKPRLVSVPVGHSNEELAAKLAETGAVPPRREIMRQFGIGTGRATTIARRAEELIAS